MAQILDIERGSDIGAATEFGDQVGNPLSETHELYDTTLFDDTASAEFSGVALAAHVRTVLSRLETETESDPLSDETDTGLTGRFGQWRQSTFGRLATAATLALTLTMPVAACSAAKQPPVAAGSQNGAGNEQGGKGGGEDIDSSPNIHAMTEDQAAHLSIDQIRQIVAEKGWANVTMLPGYSIDPTSYTAADIFNMYQRSHYAIPSFNKELLAESNSKGECPSLHLIAHGMEPIWYRLQCHMLPKYAAAINDNLGIDDGNHALDDPINKVIALKDGSLLAALKIGNASQFHEEMAYMLLMKLGAPKDQPGATAYYAIRVGDKLFTELSQNIVDK